MGMDPSEQWEPCSYLVDRLQVLWSVGAALCVALAERVSSSLEKVSINDY